MRKFLLIFIPIVIVAFVFLAKTIFPILNYEVKHRDPRQIIQLESNEHEVGISTITGIEGIIDQKDNYVGELIHMGIGEYMASENLRVYPLIYVCAGESDCADWETHHSVSLNEFEDLTHKEQCRRLSKKYCYVRNWRIILGEKNEINKLIEVK